MLASHNIISPRETQMLASYDGSPRVLGKSKEDNKSESAEESVKVSVI